jgi:RNA polymerase-binding transcription factor DksA
MADTIDDAQAYNEVYQKVSLDNFRARLAPEVHPDFDGINCVDCGDTMPKQRLVLGRIRCVECQQERESREKLYYR